jgi:alpha-glucoside transport system substrate-binding protein
MSKKTLSTLLILTLMISAFAVGFSGAQDEDLTGQTVTIFGAFTDEAEVVAINSVFDGLEAETGLNVVYEGASDFEVLINARVEAGDAPDIACFPQPGLMNRFSAQIVDVRDLLDEEYLLEQYDQSWLDMAAATDGSDKMLGVWTRIIVKSLVWYNPQMFDDFGYTVPETWDELIALSDQIVEDGGVPWSISMESGQATGWVGTDWIEDIVLRTTTLENYDAWTVPASPDERLEFSSPEIRRAWELFGDVARTDGYVLGAADRMLAVRFFDIGIPLVTEEAFMTKMGSFMPPWIDPESYDVNLGPDGNLWYFAFPPIDEEFGTPVLVSGDVCSAFRDSPAIRAVMETLTQAEPYQGAVEDGVFFLPHRDAQVEWYPEQNAGIADILASASAFRFDGGDLQPAAVGQGSFWQGIVDYVGGTQDLDTILSNIDASWPTE